VISKLLAKSKTSEKTYVIDDHVIALVAGLTADANILIEQSRSNSQKYVVCDDCSTKAELNKCLYRYLHDYQTPMPVEQIVKSVCNYKQAYTQYGGLRPFGVAFLFGGWDMNLGFQLYQTDPSGNYSGWKATVIGMHIRISSFYSDFL
jgi:20S proteasome subunit alpha 3